MRATMCATLTILLFVFSTTARAEKPVTPDSIAGATVVFDPKEGPDVVYAGVDLTSGVTILTDPAENGFSVDAQPDDPGVRQVQHRLRRGARRA